MREAAAAAGPGPLLLVGSGAAAMAIEAWTAGLKAEVAPQPALPDIGFVARLGLLADPATALARPLYLKAPDAAAQSNGVLERAETAGA